MEVLFLVKIFDDEFSPDLNVLWPSKSKKLVLENSSVCSVCAFVCVCAFQCVCDCKVNI